MTLQVELNAEQELWLRQTAIRAGVDQRTAILEVIDRQRAAEDPLAGLSDDAAQLREEIARPLPAELHDRYRRLSERCQNDTLAAGEHRELIELIGIIETHHAARVARVLKLARLQGTEFDDLMQQFGLRRQNSMTMPGRGNPKGNPDDGHRPRRGSLRVLPDSTRLHA